MPMMKRTKTTCTIWIGYVMRTAEIKSIVSSCSVICMHNGVFHEHAFVPVLFKVEDLKAMFDKSRDVLNLCSDAIANSSSVVMPAFDQPWPESGYVESSSVLQNRKTFLDYVSSVLESSQNQTSNVELIKACKSLHNSFVDASMALDRSLKSNDVTLNVLILKELQAAQGNVWHMHELTQLIAHTG